jgi:hypothetical protein
MDLAGRWRILEMDLWDRDAFDLVGPAFIEFSRDGTGSFGFIAVQGWMDCRQAEIDGLPVWSSPGTGPTRAIKSAAEAGRPFKTMAPYTGTSTSTWGTTQGFELSASRPEVPDDRNVSLRGDAVLAFPGAIALHGQASQPGPGKLALDRRLESYRYPVFWGRPQAIFGDVVRGQALRPIPGGRTVIHRRPGPAKSRAARATGNAVPRCIRPVQTGPSEDHHH